MGLGDARGHRMVLVLIWRSWVEILFAYWDIPVALWSWTDWISISGVFLEFERYTFSREE